MEQCHLSCHHSGHSYHEWFSFILAVKIWCILAWVTSLYLLLDDMDHVTLIAAGSGYLVYLAKLLFFNKTEGDIMWKDEIHTRFQASKSSNNLMNITYYHCYSSALPITCWKWLDRSKRKGLQMYTAAHACCHGSSPDCNAC